MISPKLTLTISGVPDLPAEVLVHPGRFSIGRSDDNDLVINLPGLSRRHALISNFEGNVQITDCGSQNGTFVNGLQIETTVELRNGDVISLGNVCEIYVQLQRNDEAGKQTIPSHPLPDLTGSKRHSQTDQKSLRAPMIATVSAASIVLVAILAIVILKIIDGNSDHNSSIDHTTPTVITPTPTMTSSPARPCEELTARKVENAAKQVIKRISTDPNDYAFPPDPNHLNRIKGAVEKYCASSSLGRAIERLKQSEVVLKQLSANQISPNLLAYAALAETDGGGSDPLGSAKEAAPKLIAVWKLFGDSNANSALILLAAYKIGEPGRGSHPILNRMSRAGINPDTERNVWELYRKGGLSETEYDFISRFLALGIIAFKPHEFGIDASPLIL